MEYKFKSMFNRETEYTIETDEPLGLYDNFALSIKKFDNSDKSYGYDNIVCILKYNKRGTLGLTHLELDASNFSGFYMFVEKFKGRNCLSMGEPIELIEEEVHDEFENTNLENANNELRMAFNDYVDKSSIMEVLFKTFLAGVSYGKKKCQI